MLKFYLCYRKIKKITHKQKLKQVFYIYSYTFWVEHWEAGWKQTWLPTLIHCLITFYMLCMLLSVCTVKHPEGHCGTFELQCACAQNIPGEVLLQTSGVWSKIWHKSEEESCGILFHRFTSIQYRERRGRGCGKAPYITLMDSGVS